VKKLVLIAVSSAVLSSLAACSGASSQPADSPHHPSSGVAVAQLSGQILFERITGMDDQALYIADADGSHARRISEPAQYCCARISPDHDRFTVMPGGNGLQPSVVRGGTIHVDGSHFERLPSTARHLSLVPQAWSPDGTRIAFEGWDESDPARTGVYTARASDGGDLVRVTTFPGRPHDMPLDYSPDGKRLVFYHAVSADTVDIGGSLWVVGVDGSDAHQITTADAPPGVRARWSPDGSKILFASERLQPDGALWTVEPDGSHLTKLFEDEQGRFPSVPTWSPDGRHIMFALNDTSNTFVHVANGIYVIRGDGTGLSLVIGGPDYKTEPEWWQ
jgi:Tol biopolymer transport system component